MSTSFTIGEHGECMLGGVLLHPPGDPLAAAREELGALLEKSRSDDTLLMVGGGLGWHAQAVLERDPGPRLVVYEPEAERLAWWDCLGGMSRARLELVRDEQELASALGREMIYGDSRRVAFFAARAYQRACPDMVARAREIYEQARSRNYVDHQTKQDKTLQWLEHLASNLKYVTQLCDISLMAGLMEGMPALVIGAGPSLDQSLAQLEGVRDKALILAAASACRPLAKAGVSPHLALALEAKDESRQFTGAAQIRTVLGAAMSSHPNHFRSWSGPRALFHLQPWLANLLGQGQALPSGGHATSAAFSLAILLGCDPIILLGQDLAYTGGRMHAADRPGGEDEERPETTPVPAIGGGRVETSHVMLSYITWYQEAAAYLRGQTTRRIVNATAAGAMLSGFQHRDLGSVLAELTPLPIDFKDITTALKRLPRPRTELVSNRLAQARSGIRRAQLVIETDGLEAGRSLAPTGGVVQAALECLADRAGEEEALEVLERMVDVLRGMSEALHG